MQTIAVLNRRGGVGKTATAHALGAGLKRRGYKVLFIDLDSQTNLTYDAGAAAVGCTAYEVLMKQASAKDAIRRTEQADIIPGNASLADPALEKTDPGRLKSALQEIAGDYDFCVIDTPPALGILTTNALTAADGVIITAQAEIHSLQGIDLLQDTITAAREAANPTLRIYGILLTRYNGRAIISRDMKELLEEAAADMGTKVFAAPIRECTAVKEAQALSQDIFTYARRSNAAKDYDAFIGELLTDIGGGKNGK